MYLEDGLLEVIVQKSTPFLHRFFFDDFAAAARRLLWPYPRESLFGADADRGLHHDYPILVEIESDGLHHVADACSETGFRLDEEGAVGSEPCGDFFHPACRKSHAEHAVERRQRIGTVSRPSSHASLCGNVLPE